MARFTRQFTADLHDIDELGHVNNAVWVRWMQDVAVSHWAAVAPPADVARYVWVVTRHEIDYRGNVKAGDPVIAETWVEDPPRGARFDRRMRFVSTDGRPLVEARSTWAMIDRETGRLVRVPASLADLFLERDRQTR